MAQTKFHFLLVVGLLPASLSLVFGSCRVMPDTTWQAKLVQYVSSCSISRSGLVCRMLRLQVLAAVCFGQPAAAAVLSAIVCAAFGQLPSTATRCFAMPASDDESFLPRRKVPGCCEVAVPM